MCDRPGSLMDSKLSQTTIGVLYPGELGSTFAKLLVESRFRLEASQRCCPTPQGTERLSWSGSIWSPLRILDDRTSIFVPKTGRTGGEAHRSQTCVVWPGQT